ncbi:MAG: eukaryotic-like serine/threonine-protein kinase [Pyrinomonadaceae bacterium]|jgi:serine/threonine protein kinase/Tol biopolymer transport system component|nr:eukaryotic-like serine/threonine-protein kinase [Pyrinomonadaceae bacterium]
MTIEVGTKLGRYEIRSKIGAGGMGEVYLAQDTELDRKVALKILPADVALKQGRMRRFVQEAKAAAALNHPNIAHIYEIGEAGGLNFIALEFVDGFTLREAIHREHTELRKLLRYLQQAAEGLAKAHAAGIVHRDLKPDNIMITRDGYAKILDFGLAKLVDAHSENLATDSALSEVATAMMPQHSLPGTVMGTVGYMSPEQAQGRVKEIDHRSDVFAFGCILFEAATRRKAFEGKDTLDSLHNIVHAPTPVIKDFNSMAPEDLQRIVRRCLAKDPEKRYQSIKEVSIELDEVRQELKLSSEVHDSVHQTTSNPVSTTSDQSHQSATFEQSAASSTQLRPASTSSAQTILNELTRSKRGVAIILMAVVLVVAAAITLWLRFGGNKPVASSGKMQITRLVTGLTGRPGQVGISPDGKYIAYSVYEAGKAGLWVRQVSQDTSLQVVPPVEETWFGGTTFSNDGELIYFVSGNNKTDTLGTLYQIPVLGAREPKKILAHVSSPVSFSPDGKQFAFVRYHENTGESALFIANTDGSGEPKKLASRSGESWLGQGGAWSPDGKTIAFMSATTAGGFKNSLVGIPAAGGDERPISDHKWSNNLFRVLWIKNGAGLIVNGSERPDDPIQIWSVSYPEGRVSKITNDVNEYGAQSLGVTSDSSTIATLLGEWSTKIWIAAPNDDESHAKRITNGKQDGRSGISTMPDGRIVYSAKVGENSDIWIMNADGSGAKALTSDAFTDSHPVVSPDGKYIVYQSFRPDNVPHIWRMDADGSNQKQLTSGTEDRNPTISPDGRWIAFHSFRTGKGNLWKMTIDGGELAQISDRIAYNANFSPDGKLLSCNIFDESVSPARYRQAILSFADGALVRVLDLPTTAGTVSWLPGGKDYVYVDKPHDIGNIWSQPVAGGPAKQLTKFGSDFIDYFDVSRDGKRFIVSRSTGGNDIILIKNFLND